MATRQCLRPQESQVKGTHCEQGQREVKAPNPRKKRSQLQSNWSLLALIPGRSHPWAPTMARNPAVGELREEA